MIALIRYTLSLFLFWLICFFPMRVFFVLYQGSRSKQINPPHDFYLSFIEGYKLDLATATILCGIPMLLALVYYVFRQKIIERMAGFVVGFLLIIYQSIGLADAGIYREWVAKVNLQALAHFSNPSEIFKTISVRDQVLFVVLLLAFVLPFLWFYKKKIHPFIRTITSTKQQRPWLSGFLFLIVSTGMSIVLIRGGITSLPMSQSAAYFSTSSFANDIAVNPLYNLLQDITVQGQAPESSQYHFMTDEEAQSNLKPYFQTSNDSFPHILQTQKPNLVFVVLESWSADVVSCLGGMPGVTPCFDSLSKESLLFSNCIASAYISDQGIPSIFSAAPGLSRISPISMPHVAQRMPSLVSDYANQGYSTLFFYGGDPVFGNIKGYVVKKGFQNIVDYKQLQHLPQGQLGVHDAEALDEFLLYCNKSKQPFLNTLFTLSTHMPYDFKTNITWKGDASDPEKRYTESVHYADAALGNFMAEAKKQAWYPNTLFVFVSDHSHNTFRNSELSYAQRHHIPLLFFGEVLKPEYRNRVIENYVSQLDIASTLLHQTHMDAGAYHWSRNMLHPATISAAYFPFFGGTGYIDSSGYASKYLLGGAINSTCKDSMSTQQHYKMAQSFLQLIYKETMEK